MANHLKYYSATNTHSSRRLGLDALVAAFRQHNELTVFFMDEKPEPPWMGLWRVSELCAEK